MHTGKITDQDIQLIKMLKAADDAEERKRKPAEFKPAPRIRDPWKGALNWKRHKAKQAGKRKARNVAARKSRKAQRRAS